MITSRNSTAVDMLFREFYSSPNFIHASLSHSSSVKSYHHLQPQIGDRRVTSHPRLCQSLTCRSLSCYHTLSISVFHSIKSLLIILFSFWMIYRWLSLGGYFYFWKLLLAGIYFMFSLVFIIYWVVSNLVYVVTSEFF